MIAAFGYNGFSCMEFKRDMRDGVYKLMELNGRHNHSSLLDLACGINFPYYSYVRALDRTVPVPQVVQSDGVYWLDELKDIRGALAACRKGGGGLGRFLRPYLRRHASAVVSLADPLPSLHTLADGVAAIVGRRSRAEPRFRASGDFGEC